MPTAYIYRGTFEVRAGETLRYVEVAPDGTIGPEVTKTYAELAGSGSIAAAAVSLTPTVTAPTLTGVQIGAIAGVPVSLQPTVSPAAVSGVQAGSIAAASVSLRPTVAAPSVTGVRVGSINAAAVSLQPTVATGEITGVTVQTGSISAAAVTCQPAVAVGTLTGVTAPAGATETFSNAFTSWPYTGDVGTWTRPATNGANTRVSGGSLILPMVYDADYEQSDSDYVRLDQAIPAGTLTVKCRLGVAGSITLQILENGTLRKSSTISSTTQATVTHVHSGMVGLDLKGFSAADVDGKELLIDEVSWV